MRTFSSFQRRKVETDSGRSLGRCHDLRGELERPAAHHRSLRRPQRHGSPTSAYAHHARHDVIPWEAVIRIEGRRIVVRDDAEER